ncbi:amidohydrolase [Urechidicola croceus]|uniref:Omega-amidase YafV n=1 Tax=Urechidicola croceus TaxID=1850246 RepID=A0A1D8P9T5_9FLAO|nr:amidohydrolase [Urechidicola croceus]AOW21360.1 nitrilase family protein [Urechidicola croceus]
MKEKLNIVAVQADIFWEDIDANIKNYNSILLEISHEVDLIVLPEMFSTGFSMEPYTCAEKMNGISVSWMIQIAKEKQVAITGSLIIKENDEYYNRLVFVFPNGRLETYDKRHLFSLGGEDKFYSSGREKLIVEYKGWKIFPLICYDLRFPVWSRNTDDYHILIYVANWPKPRINAWDSLLKARAIENMCYVIGVNRVGLDGNNLEYIGHSQVYDILGNELERSKTKKDDVISCILDIKTLNKARKELSFLNDKDSFFIEK